MKQIFPLPPGIVSDDTRLAAKGRWADGSNVRFVDGLPEVIGGWESFIGELLGGVCRSIFQWTDKAGTLSVGFGTHSSLSAWVGGALADITPTLSLPARTLAPAPLSVTNASAIVSVSMPGHGLVTGESAIISGAAAVGGITLAGTYAITVTGADAFTVTHGSAASATATGGGSAVVVTPQRALAAGQIDGAGGSGFGTGGYGVGGFGDPSTTDYFPRTWAMAAWGENLVASPRGGTIYLWENDLGANAEPVKDAPADVRYALVSSTDQLFAFGCNEEVSGVFNPLCIRHSSVRDISSWYTTPASTAREYILPGGGEIVAARNIGDYIAVWTTNSLYLGQFTGTLANPWTFTRVAEHCGLIGPNAAVVVGLRAMWLSPDLQFRTYTLGGEVVPVDCQIRRDMADNLAPSQGDKVVASSISRFNEVRFDYPDARDGYENSRYVAVSLKDGSWYRGQMARTAMVDAGPNENPIGATYGGAVYLHERGSSADGGIMSWFVETTELLLDANTVVLIRGAWPDVARQVGPWLLSVYTRLKPQGAVRAYGPFATTSDTFKSDFRATGRLFRFRWAGSSAPTGGRLGSPIFDMKATTGR